jgi:hypothetical protein
MFVVRVKDSKEIIAMCSRIEDAEQIVSGGNIDKQTYVIEKMKVDTEK